MCVLTGELDKGHAPEYAPYPADDKEEGDGLQDGRKDVQEKRVDIFHYPSGSAAEDGKRRYKGA